MQERPAENFRIRLSCAIDTDAPDSIPSAPPLTPMLDLYDKIEESVAGDSIGFSRDSTGCHHSGTGLGGLVDQVDVKATIEYGDIPHFPTSTATSHRGRLVCGHLDGVPIIAMEGRFHMYEGYPLKQITLPVRVFKRLGAELLIVSNACGGLNPYYQGGDIMVIEDQINLMGDNPLIGINDDRLGPRFPDMCEPYDQQWIDRTIAIGRQATSKSTKECLLPSQGRTWRRGRNTDSCEPSARMWLE